VLAAQSAQGFKLERLRLRRKEHVRRQHPIEHHQPVMA
jgi:hypothetical protein